MGERNYVVYMPTPLGKGIIVAVFVSKIAAAMAKQWSEYIIQECEQP